MGNSTVLVWNLDQAIKNSDYNKLANKIMTEEYLPCEQVGFIEPSKSEKAVYKLSMMGGELCVNALRCLAYLHFHETKETKFSIESSGSEELFNMEISESGSLVTLRFEMTIPNIQISKSLGLIHLEGISHFVEDLPDVGLTYSQIENRLDDLLIKHASEIGNVQAIGYIPYQAQDDIKITPLVFVRDTGTKILESSCGSGTIAVGLHEYVNGRKDSIFTIKQPSEAVFKVSVDKIEGDKYSVSIASTVELVSKGELFIEL